MIERVLHCRRTLQQSFQIWLRWGMVAGAAFTPKYLLCVLFPRTSFFVKGRPDAYCLSLFRQLYYKDFVRICITSANAESYDYEIIENVRRLSADLPIRLLMFFRNDRRSLFRTFQSHPRLKQFTPHSVALSPHYSALFMSRPLSAHPSSCTITRRQRIRSDWWLRIRVST